jgi:hypothetical protein
VYQVSGKHCGVANATQRSDEVRPVPNRIEIETEDTKDDLIFQHRTLSVELANDHATSP